MPSGVPSRPTGRVAAVERLLQVLAVLGSSDGGWVPRTHLVQRVDDYRARRGSAEALERLIENDTKALAALGFAIEVVGDRGEVAVHRLGRSSWRVPVDLDTAERTLLGWAMTRAGLSVDGTVASDVPAVPTLDGVLPAVPRGLDRAQAALAGRRRLRVRRHGRDAELEPACLALKRGRWFLFARYGGTEKLYGFALEHVDVLGLGDVMEDAPRPPYDVARMLDQLLWDEHDPIAVELRCDRAALPRVQSWFRPAEVCEESADEVRLRLETTNRTALVDRVLGLAGDVAVVSPPDVVGEIRARALAYCGDGG